MNDWLRPRVIWAALLVGALIGGLAFAHALMEGGPRVTVSFASGAGLAIGKTRVRYRGVDIGRLARLHISADGLHVYAELQLDAAAQRAAMCGTKFWVVRPRIDVRDISGLMTAVTGTWIDVDIDRYSIRACHAFTGLDMPPVMTGEEEGARFVLRAASLGSLHAGSPVYFRGAQVGQVLGYSLERNGGNVRIGVFVRKPFDRLVASSTRWWQSSGVEFTRDSAGMRLDSPPSAALLEGGVAFDTSHGNVRAEANANANANANDFPLAGSRADAMRANYGPPAVVQMRFAQSVRGLSVGAPVEFRGVVLGTVTAVDIDLKPTSEHFDMLVTLSLYPSRLGQSYRNALGDDAGAAGKVLLRDLVVQGLRAQVRTGSLLTGQKYIALDVFPHAPPAHIDTDRSSVELPTLSNSLEELQEQLSTIVHRLDQMPINQIGSNLDATLQQSNALFARLDAEVVPAAHSTLESAQRAFRAAKEILDQGSPLQSDVGQALTELRRTLAGLNALSDYLERHPEALIQGKGGDH